MKKIIAIFMLSIAALFLCYALSSGNVANRDSISYWAAGKLLISGHNPYDSAAVLAIERAHGFNGAIPNMMRNPPSALWLAILLGIFPERLGGVLWSLGIVALIMASIRMLWRLHKRPNTRLHLVGYLFAPVLATLLAGQTSALMLFGVCAFLVLQERHPFLAGSALALCSIKPHLFLPLAVVFCLWVRRERAYSALAGAVSCIGASTLCTLLLRPRIWLEYRSMMHAENLSVPTLASLLRMIHPQWPWLQYVPVIVACLWAVWYFRRTLWSWPICISPILLVCILTAPYAWFTDEAILLPAIFAFLYASEESPRRMLLFGACAGASLLEVLCGVSLFSPFYLWTPIAWTVIYCLKPGERMLQPDTSLRAKAGNAPRYTATTANYL